MEEKLMAYQETLTNEKDIIFIQEVIDEFLSLQGELNFSNAMINDMESEISELEWELHETMGD